MPRKDAYTGPISAQAQQDLVSEGIENYELPKSVVMKIAKSSIPDNVKLQKETVLSLVKGSTVFINYLGGGPAKISCVCFFPADLCGLAATAHDVAISKQHKSISASDVLKALETLEFSDMVEPLQGELQVYRQLTKTSDRKSEKKKAPNPPPAAVPSTSRKTIISLPIHPISPDGAPLPQQADHEPLYDVPMDVDSTTVNEDIHVDGREVREDEEVPVEEVPVEDEISEDDPIVESDGSESDELEDKVALEDEELRKDNQGLEEPPTAMVIHED